jgi:GntR family transcriptional regulator/MocR family aminotransferase
MRAAPSTLDQLTLSALIRSGWYDRHLRRMRTIYARRRAQLIAALAAARERLVGLHGMASYRARQGVAAPQLVLGFGNVSEHAIEPAIRAVVDLLR